MTEEQKKDELREEVTEEQKPEDAAEGAEEAKAEEKAEEQPAEKPEEKKEEDEDLNTRYMRLMADFQNFRRRTDKEKSDIYAYGNEKLVLELLPVLDNFERALAAAEEGDKFAEGMQLIYKQMVDALTKNKVEEIEAEGKPFDHNLHNAVMRQPQEGAESDTIINVLQKGYKLNGKVVRPSMVIVAE